MQKRITSFVFALLLLFASNSFGQQVIGEFPQMDGGFEGQTLGTLVGTSIATGTQRTDWTTSSSNLGGIYTGDTTRTGNKALWAFTTSTAKRWQSPTAAESAIASSTAYTVQFYYRTNGTTATATCMQVGVQGNGTTNTAYTTAASWAGTNNVWTKMQIACTSPAVTASPRYGIGLIRANTPTMGVVLYVDDFVCYAGAADNTAPDAVTSPVTSNQAATVQTVSWTAPVSGVDGGGYLVLRSTSIPNTDPSLNGIYALNDTIGNATIAYIGTSSTFVDNGLTALTTYYYKIYTVDKAFNYSPSASVTGTTVEPSFAIEPTVQASSIVFDNIQSNSLDISWTSGNGSNRVVIAHAGTAVDVTPADGSIYSANATFGSGSQIGTGNYVVYNGTGSSVSVSGLSKATTYHFTVFEFNGSSGSENYLLTNPPVASKATRPSLKTSNGSGGGDWSVAATWTGGQAPGVGDSVVILSTDIIRLNSTGSCYNLHVLPSGVLQTGVILPTGSLVYLRVYGSSMIVDGTLGGEADALGIEFFTDVTLSGTGTIRPARVRPGASVSNATFTFDANTTVTYNGTTGGGGSAVYVENSSNDNIGIKVNSGKTLTFVDGGNFNTNSSSAGLSNVNTLFTIDGTVDMPGSNSNMSLTVTSAKTCSLVVNGTLNVGHSLNAANVATAGNVFITVNSPGSMTVATPDFMNSSVYVSGTGTFTLPANGAIRIGHTSGLEPVAGPIRTATRNFSANASYSYIGTVPQSTGSDLPLTVSSFTANNSAGVTLSNSLTVNGFYNDGMGTLTSGGNTLTYGPYAGVRYNDTSAVQTTSDFDFPAVNGPQNLYIDNSRGVNLHASRTIADTLYLVTGKFYLGNNDLTMGANSAALGAVNSAKFLAQNGTGRLKKQFTAPGTFSFPLGDSTTTAAGCPVVLKFNSGTFSSGEVVVTTSNVKHPGNSSTNNYLNRYWTIASTGISGFNADVTARYPSTEVTGDEQQMFTGLWNGSTWTGYDAAIAASDSLKMTGITNFGDLTGGEFGIYANITAIPEGYYDEVTGTLRLQDTAKVYLANITTPYAFIDSAFVVIDDTTFSGRGVFTKAAAGTYYLVFKGRNFIETWSKTSGEVFAKGSTVNYNFTTAATQATGSNMILKGTKWCVYSGDVNQDNFIDFSDLTLIDNDSYNFASGYLTTDVNGDLFVDFSDLTLVDNNSYNFIGGVTPSTKRVAKPAVKPAQVIKSVE